MTGIDRRRFMQFGGAALAGALGSAIDKALAIPANDRTRSIKDIEHIVILTQENRPFDHHFGTLRGVRGFADPRAVDINLPLQSGGSVRAPVFLQPAGSTNVGAGFSFPAASVGGPADAAPVIPPFRIDPSKLSPSPAGLGFAYMGGTNHGWTHIHQSWNYGQYDGWALYNGPMTMSYFTRADIPYHYALADAFTVLDAYHCSIMGPTNPNRCYLWTGSIGNVDYLGAAGTDGHGAGPITGNGLSPNNQYLAWETLPEVLDKAGVSWKIYQDIAGHPFAPDFGDGTNYNFAGNYTDNSLLYFAQYANAAPGTSLFDNAATGTSLSTNVPGANASDADWKAWAEGLFSQFKADVEGGKLPQVSWLVAPAGFTEHSSNPVNYGAWYISQVLNILVANPEVFSKTVFIINYDEADGSFDHVVPPSPPPSPSYPAALDLGGSTVDYHNEIVTDSTPNGPIGLGSRVPCIVISPWSKGGYVNSQVFDHTSTVQLIEKRFGVYERNISPWRRAVCGDMTSVFNFRDPNRRFGDDDHARLPSTNAYLPSVGELSGAVNPLSISVTASNVIPGVPAQEKGVRPARALPYELEAYAAVDDSNGTVVLTFLNSGKAGAVFHVRSANPADAVRMYTVEAGKSLTGAWSVAGAYDLAVYGPNGFARYFKGNVGGARVQVRSSYIGDDDDGAQLRLSVANHGSDGATVTILDAYSGETMVRSLGGGGGRIEGEIDLNRFRGWYDLVVTVAQDPGFRYRIAGHVESGRDSISDPAMGGLVTLKV